MRCFGRSDSNYARTNAERMHTDCRYVAFGGCGCKGVSYIGFLRALQERDARHAEWHAELRGACGVSSGTIAALAFLVDVDATSFLSKWAALNLTSVISSTCFNINGILAEYGIDDGTNVKRIIGEILTACGLAQDTTFEMFARLTRKDLRVYATNLNQMRIETFSAHTTPDVQLASAFYWSMCVPFVFKPERFRGDMMIDGCALAFVPVDEWPIEQTLILYAKEATNTRPRDIKDIRSYATTVLACCAISMMHRVDAIREKHPDRVVPIRFEDEHMDTFISLQPGAFDRLVAKGYNVALDLISPQLAQTIGLIVKSVASDFSLSCSSLVCSP